MTDDALLAEQLAYYRARAPEYDHWWDRTAQYRLADDDERQWWDERHRLEEWVTDWLGATPRPAVLELACGTGNWTRYLAPLAARVVAVDAAPETIEIARAKIPAGADVEFVHGDVFGWEPPEREFDVVFFSFWLSHVPPDRFDSFWDGVQRALRPGGRAVVVDNRRSDGVWPKQSEPGGDPVQLRTDLSSGDAYRVVKVYYEPDELESRLASMGWRASFAATGRFFVAGWAQPGDGTHA